MSMALQAGHAKALQPLECRDPRFQSIPGWPVMAGSDQELTVGITVFRWQIVLAVHVLQVVNAREKIRFAMP